MNPDPIIHAVSLAMNLSSQSLPDVMFDLNCWRIGCLNRATIDLQIMGR